MHFHELSYDEIRKEAERARNPEKGRPVPGSSVLRMHPKDGRVELTFRKRHLATFRPGNLMVVRFSVDAPSSVYRKIGLVTYPKGKHTAVVHTEALPRQTVNKYGLWHAIDELPTHIPAIHQLTFDMATGECLHAPNWPVRTEYKDVATEWRSKLRAFKRGLKTMEKVGAFNFLVEDLEVTRNSEILRDDAYTDQFRQIIESNEPLQMAELLLEVSWGYRYSLKNGLTKFTDVFDSEYTRLRDDVRARAGCFKEEITYGTADRVDMAA